MRMLKKLLCRLSDQNRIVSLRRPIALLLAIAVPFATMSSLSFRVNADVVDDTETTVTEQTEQVFEEVTLTAEGEDYSVSVTCGAEAEIPSDAQLAVEEIPLTSAEYGAYYEQTASVISDNASLSRARFFDISILSQGLDVQPAAPVNVVLTLDDSTIEENEEQQVLHFGEEPETLSVQTEDDAISFETDGFSVFGVVYTVDFTYGEYIYCLPGGGEILLSELLARLGVEASLQNSSAAFSDDMPEGLVSLEAVYDGDSVADWRITSLNPFNTKHTLTITFGDGTEIVIGVTDEQSGTAGQGITWTLTDNGVLTLTGTGNGNLNRFPSGLNKEDIREIVISDGVKVIGSDMFSSCANLTKVSAINQTDLTQLSPRAFNGCTALETVDLQGCTNLVYIGDGSSYLDDTGRGSTFYGCTSLKTVNLNGCSSLKQIHGGTFQNCSALTNVDFTGCSALEIIGGYSFRNCAALTSIESENLPALRYIGSSAFRECTSLKNVDLSPCTALATIVREAFYGCTAMETLNLSGCVLSSIGENAFQKCTSLLTADLSNSGLASKGLSQQIFRDCTSLVSVDFSGCENLLELRALFNNCSSLTTVNLSNCTNLEKFLNSSLRGLASLTTVNVDGCTSLTTIAQEAFRDSPKLNFDLNDIPNLEYLGGGAFQNNRLVHASDLSQLTHLKEIYSGTFNSREFIDDLDLSNCKELAVIGGSAFQNLKNIHTINLSGAGTEAKDSDGNFIGLKIGDKAFEQHNAGNKQIELVDFSYSGIVEVGNSAFTGHGNSIAALDLTGCVHLKTIGSGAFSLSGMKVTGLSDCIALEEIKSGAFQGTSIENLDLSACASLATIGSSAFKNCASLEEVSLSGCVKLTEIGSSAFENTRKLSAVDFSGCDVLEEIGSQAFYNCTSLYEANLKECTALTTIGTQAFRNCSSLEEVVIPDSVTSIASDSFLGCSGIQVLEWRAENYTAPLDKDVFSSAGNYELHIGENVENLPPGFFRALKNAGEVYFDSVPGGHVIHIADSAVTASGQELFAQIENDIYVDADGVVYELFSDTHTARLAYCPPGVTVCTVPKSITADGESYTVNAIAPSALTKARDLTELHFEDPTAITSIGENAAFGVRALIKVVDDRDAGEATTIQQAQHMFPNAGTVPASAFRRTGLTDDVTDYVWKNGIKSNSLAVTDGETEVDVKLPATGYFAHEDRTYDYLTGKFFSVPISAHTSNQNGAYVHIFLDFTNGGYSGLEDNLVITDGNGTKIAEAELRDTTDPDIKCLTFNVTGGSTAAMTLNLTYPSPVSEGGEMRLWVDIVDEHDTSDQMTPVLNTSLNGGNRYMHARWSTERIEREPRKVALSSRVTIKGSGDPLTPETFYVRASSWRIFLDRVNEKDNDKIGQDFATSAQFSDQLTLPTGVEWNAKVLDALKQGTYTFKHRKLDSKRHQYTLLVDGKEAIYLEFPEEVTAQRINFSVDEQNNVLATWTVKNPKTTEDLTNNPIIFGVFDDTLVMDLSQITVKEDGVTRPATEKDFPLTFEIINNVEAKVSYTHSAMSEPAPATATMRAIADKANPELTKTRSGGDTMHLGDDVTFFLTAANTGAQSTTGIDYIDDTLADGVVRLLYITPENMQRMFSEEFGDRLTVTINNAKRYSWAQSDKSSVTTVSGGTAVLTDKNSGALELISDSDTIVIVKTGSGYQLTLNPDTDNAVYTGTSVAELLNDIGYYVTENDYYHVRWDFNKAYRLMGGAEFELPIYATHKNTFQLIDSDNAVSYKNGASWSEIMTNTGYMHYEYINTQGDPEEKVISDYITRYTVTKDVKVTKGIDTKPSDNGYDNGQIILYHLAAENSGEKDFDDLPMTDEIYGAQVLLVRADLNPSLSSLGLDTVDNGSYTYYILREGSYSHIYVGSDSRYLPALADSVTVTKMIDRSGNIVYTTRVYWCLDQLASGTAEKINYYTIVSALDKDGNQQREYYFNNVVYLNDRRDDRLYDTLRESGATYGVDKKIVTVLGDENHVGEEFDEDNHTWLTSKKNTATYKLSIIFDPSNSDWTVSFNGDEIFDILPQTFSTFNWVKGQNIFIEFAPHGDVQYSTNFITDWSISDTAGDMVSVPGQQYIVFPDDATLTLHGVSTLDMYVTCIFSSEEDWDHYAETAEGNLVKNTFCVNDHSAYVTHDLKTRAKAYLQKGVNYIYQIGATDSREEYGNTFGHVEYYTLLYNGGNTNLYLSDMIDMLPRGFTLRSVNGISNAYVQTNAKQTTDCVTLKNKEYLRSNNKPAVIDDGETEVVFKAVRVKAKTLADNRLQFSFEGSESDPDFAQLDKEVEMYYLAPHEALAFTYTLDVDSRVANTDSTALNRIVMEYDDPTALGISMYNIGSGSVKGCQRDAAPYNDGECLPYEGYEGLQSYVSIRRGEPVPGITKDVVSYSFLGENLPTHDGAVVSAADTFEWDVTVKNAGYNNINGYSIVDTMEAPYRFLGEVWYKIYDVDGKTVDTIYESAGTFERPLFTVVKNDGGTVIIEDIQGHRHSAAVGGAPVTLTIPYIYENYSGVKNTYISDEKNSYTFTVGFAVDPESGDQIMTVHFNEGTLSLLPKCEGRLTLYTKTTELMTNREFVNSAVFLPDDLSYERVAVGKRLYDENNENAGIYSESSINIVEGGGTTSLKAVEENVNPDNYIDSSDSDNNIITLADKQNDFTYTLTVTNSTKKTFRTLVIADHLPEAGDHYSLRNAVPRGSEYTVHFFDEHPETPDTIENTVTATVTRGAETITLTSSDYTVMYSDKTSFSNEDMNGEDDGWTTTCYPSSRSVRIVFNEHADIRDEDVVNIRFKAISDDEAKPSQVAYNGFVYWYDNGTVSMHAATHLVGVRIPDFPALQKKTINRFGIDDVASEDTEFYFLVYEGDRLEFTADELLEYDAQGKPLLSDEKPVLSTDARVELEAADRRFTTAKLTLNKGESLSDVQSLYTYDFWKTGRTYTIMELPVHESYALSRWKMENTSTFLTSGDSVTFTYDDSVSQTVVAVNKNLTWQFNIHKISDYNGNSLPGAVFALYSPDAQDVIADSAKISGNTYTYQRNLTIPVQMEYEDAVWYLSRIAVTDNSGNISFDHLSRESYVYREIKAPLGFILPEKTEHIVMSTDTDSAYGTVVSREITNHYGYRIPSYGGLGTCLFFFVGIPMVVIPSVVLLYRYRKRRINHIVFNKGDQSSQ